MHIIFAGECMVEFRRISKHNYARSFAGDVYNTSIYTKRTLADKAKVSANNQVKQLQVIKLQKYSNCSI